MLNMCSIRVAFSRVNLRPFVNVPCFHRDVSSCARALSSLSPRDPERNNREIARNKERDELSPPWAFSPNGHIGRARFAHSRVFTRETSVRYARNKWLMESGGIEGRFYWRQLDGVETTLLGETIMPLQDQSGSRRRRVTTRELIFCPNEKRVCKSYKCLLLSVATWTKFATTCCTSMKSRLLIARIRPRCMRCADQMRCVFFVGYFTPLFFPFD